MHLTFHFWPQQLVSLTKVKQASCIHIQSRLEVLPRRALAAVLCETEEQRF